MIVRLAGHDGADADAGSNDKAVMTDLLAAQQKATEDLEAIDRAITDQQEQLKAIVNKLASLSSKVDALKNPAPEIAAVPPASPFPDHTTAPPVSTASTARPLKHTPLQKQKQAPRVASPSGPISVGGAPLDIAPGNPH
ncbi:hypothetical protein HAP41_0000030440 [Bradyrhizobium barranii subsp. apii]|uniref:Uncharacterized protein n=1 Tax=Bradyrhizobium barranii subsp. apii TaxID=2819348 RepID=A0A8T5VDE0_9BRAD|nr:hypothetical protein [Bradyrhizobium barranii]UPT84656.1 hypothetical protein HAP41_0000030440 [Bradyrhizobium barranii subsp. apii]UPT93243.1 hypothetical protein J4G48_0028080 [Bradyrhizobium barranii subsp. apii]